MKEADCANPTSTLFHLFPPSSPFPLHRNNYLSRIFCKAFAANQRIIRISRFLSRENSVTHVLSFPQYIPTFIYIRTRQRLERKHHGHVGLEKSGKNPSKIICNYDGSCFCLFLQLFFPMEFILISARCSVIKTKISISHSFCVC